MATPLAPTRGGGKAADRGVLLRSGDAFQSFPDADQVVIDKTGTITLGEVAVSEVVAVASETNDVSATAASAGVLGSHAGRRILDHADDRGVDYADPESFDSVTGKGVRATVDSAARGDMSRSNGRQRAPRDGNDVGRRPVIGSVRRRSIVGRVRRRPHVAPVDRVGPTGERDCGAAGREQVAREDVMGPGPKDGAENPLLDDHTRG